MEARDMKVIVLPGLDGTGELLTEFKTELQGGFDVQVFKYPENEPLSYTELAALVTESLPRDEPYSIIAESFSGPVATLVASRSPKGLCAIVFVASFLKKPTPLPKAIAAFAEVVPANSPLLLSLARPFTFGRWTSRALNERLLKSVRRVSPKVLASRIRQIMDVDELSKLSDVKVPMAYLKPTQDRLVCKETLAAMKAANPALDVINVEGPHFVLQTNPKPSGKIVSDFLKSLPTTG